MEPIFSGCLKVDTKIGIHIILREVSFMFHVIYCFCKLYITFRIIYHLMSKIIKV